MTVQGALARGTAIYSDKLCRAIIKGMTAQFSAGGMVTPVGVGIHVVNGDGVVEAALGGPDQGFSRAYRGDLAKQVLHAEFVQEARTKEPGYFCSRGVRVKRPKSEARLGTGRGPISVRWVDVSEGDDLHPRYRSRLVARQMEAHDRSGVSYFALVPPLEALRTVLSLAATEV